MSEYLLRPGLRLGRYPQKRESDLSQFEQKAQQLFEKLRGYLKQNHDHQAYIVQQIQRYTQPLQSCSEDQLDLAIFQLRQQLQARGLQEPLIIQAFAVIRETATRTLAKRHYDEQLFAGWLMINGRLAEMATGEGKTLATTLPACTAALAGIPVHVLTANDYLASRDAEQMQPLYQRLGLTAGFVVDGMETELRRKQYQGHIVHTTNKQVAFDYLRDRIESGADMGSQRLLFQQIQQERNPEKTHPLLLRGLCFALIDEADSILIDEANTPLIITQLQPKGKNPTRFNEALQLAGTLELNQDFSIDKETREITLTPRGELLCGERVRQLPSHWQSKRHREQLIKQALTAEYFYKKDTHYLVNENKVLIIDEFTGRIMPDRSWENGLQQMIEAKEGCELTDQREPLARISYQRFFSRYLRLGGTSGTLKEVAAELYSTYGLKTVSVNTHTPSKRRIWPIKIYATIEQKQHALLARITALYEQHRPVLIGTGSVAESELVSTWLSQAGFPHQVLNAKQDQNEADIIAAAGQKNSITVATNRAGRGTDIVLGAGVAELGGLHIIALNSNDAGRIDRQLIGRCARQGDPGSAEALLSLQDQALKQYYSSAMLKFVSHFGSENQPITNRIGKWLVRFPQRNIEKRQRQLRKQVLLQDRYLARMLAFSGKFE